jgi:hypothetical protein
MGKKSGIRGPDPERVKIHGDWKDAMGKALKKKRPTEGWPNEKKKKRSK